MSPLLYENCGQRNMQVSPQTPPLANPAPGISYAQIWRRELQTKLAEIGSQGVAQTQLLETWFARAKGRPLSLTPPTFIPLIVAAAERFHSLELQLSDDDFQLLRQKCAAFPGLRRLAILPTTWPITQHPLSIFETSLSLSDLQFEPETKPPGLPWNLPPLLTSIELCYRTTFQTLSDPFHHYPRLLELKITCLLIDDPISPLHITTPHLQCLILENSRHLQIFTLPGLRRLEVHSEDHGNELLPFLTRSSCVLEHLHFCFNVSASPQSPACFQALPALVSLSVEVSHSLMRFVQVFEEDPSLLPLLSTLILSAWSHSFDYHTHFSL
ncbi:hypothetical protein DFH06DRAFT_1360981 [Mycena polygramma]|nr:hypothetical protein DFH06DRAFT_1360981 [Mycena polygramma]